MSLDNCPHKIVSYIASGTIVILGFHPHLLRLILIVVKEFAPNGFVNLLFTFLLSITVTIIFVPVISLMQRYFPMILGNRKV